jgi:hypothetical protein
MDTESTNGNSVSHRSDGRGVNGRFTKGNPGGPGPTLAKRLHANKMQMHEAIEAEHPGAAGKIANKLIMRALSESEDWLEAARIVFPYLVGRPPAAVTVTAEDGGPIVVGNVMMAQAASEIDGWRRWCHPGQTPNRRTRPHDRNACFPAG